ncbi:tetratricopeptide (TPR) repeat protein/predicted MPP superfamily phosphohydrolase [Oxalobacteraceae bacterium GrIS 1.11]
MESRNSLRILHLSDLHIGKESSSDWRMQLVLGNEWKKNLKEIAADGPIDLVCFTGDLAQSGKPAQYVEVGVFVNELLETLKVPRNRFFCVPGNHDVDQKVNPSAWKELRTGAFDIDRTVFSRWIAGGDGKPPRGFKDAWRGKVLERQAAYRQWLASMGLHAMLPGGAHPRLGYRVSLDLGLDAPLHIVGLDSAWLAGDDNDAGKLRLTDEQLGRLLTDQGAALQGWSIALIHHPLTDLADGSEVIGLLSKFGVSLVLHGHLHDSAIARWTTPSARLHISAAGCLYEDNRYPNSMHVLDVYLPTGKLIEPRQLWARTWSGRGHWHNDDSLYPGSVNGKLALLAQAEPAIPFIPGQFIGREKELDEICNALLPKAGIPNKPTALCCVLEGMAGVGKTRLAEHFVQHHWMPALGVNDDADPADHYLRLVLDPQAPEPPTAHSLGQQLADRLRSTGESHSLWSRLQMALQSGPHRHPQLVLIENVDTDVQAKAVGELVNRLPGCPILLTARYRKLGDPSWGRVKVPEMSEKEARTLLLSEVDMEGHPLSDAEADELAFQLGYLPLALHIAASHLSLGLTPKAFLRELRAVGLVMEPAQPGDPRLTADRARAIIHSSFELSWRHWCMQNGASTAWQQALVALAHGPADSIGLSLAAAITAIDEDVYPSFVTAAARLSLLEYVPMDQKTQLHPLIAEFLRTKPEPDAAVVLRRMSSWFMRRLPKTDDEAQKQGWREIWAESVSLVHWLSRLAPQEALEVEHAGEACALQLGPYAAWQDFYEHLIRANDQPQHLSHRWWALGELARRSGNYEHALSAAKSKMNLDREQGNEHGSAIAQGQIADILEARGELDEALRIRREEELPVYDRLDDVRSRAVTMGQIADILEARGELDEALRIRREEALPVYDRLGDVRSRAVIMGKVADILQARGELDEALRIRREEQLPVYDRLGDVRSRAVTLGQIADILQTRGELDEALRIRREEELPVYGRLGDVRSRAVTMGKVADILQMRGELDEALRIRREEALPVYDRLGDVRERAVAMGKIADILETRGELDEALRIRREEQLPVYDRLGDVRSLLVARANMAQALMKRAAPGDKDEARRLLEMALIAAKNMRLPEVSVIEELLKRHFI